MFVQVFGSAMNGDDEHDDHHQEVEDERMGHAPAGPEAHAAGQHCDKPAAAAVDDAMSPELMAQNAAPVIKDPKLRAEGECPVDYDILRSQTGWQFTDVVWGGYVHVCNDTDPVNGDLTSAVVLPLLYPPAGSQGF